MGFQLYKDELYEQGQREVNNSAHQIGIQLSTQLSSRKETVELAAGIPAVTRHGTVTQRTALQDFVNETGFSGVSVIHRNGSMTNIAAGLSPDKRRSVVGSDFSNRTYFQRAIGGETYISDPIAAESGNYIVTVSTPIRHNGSIVGTLNAAYHLSGQTFAGTTRTAQDSGHEVTVYSQSDEVVYASGSVTRGDPIVRNASVEGTGWTVSVMQSRQAIESTVRTVSYLQIGSVVAVILSLSGFGWWVYRRNLHQVEALLNGFEALETQSYGTEIDVGGSEEWQQIGRSFNDMSRSLERFERERQEREHSLREFKRAVEHAGHAVFITDTKGRIQYVNPAFEEITGYSEAEALGATPDLLNSGKMSSEYFTDLWSTLLSGEEWDREITNERRNGSLYVADQAISPLTDEDGTVEEFVAIQTDITELKDRESHLQTLSRVLRHNLRNKINVIMGSAEVFLHDSDAADEATARRIIETGREITELTTKERRIVELLVDQPRPHRISLPMVLDGATATINNAYPDSEVAVTCPPDLAVEAIDQLERAIYELVENSIVHTDDASGVELTANRCSDTVRIRVEDDGDGIPPDERRILTGDADIEPLSHGSGLGIWLVHHIVRLSGGTVEYDEKDPTGSVVTIVLPCGGAS